MSDFHLIVLHASGAETATGTSADIAMPEHIRDFTVVTNITAASGGSPTLNIAIQANVGPVSYDVPTIVRLEQGAAAGPAGIDENFCAEATGTGKWFAMYRAIALDEFRLAWTIGGSTPSFTFVTTLYARTNLSGS